jgi:hypothetical protein
VRFFECGCSGKSRWARRIALPQYREIIYAIGSADNLILGEGDQVAFPIKTGLHDFSCKPELFNQVLILTFARQRFRGLN